MGKTALGMPKRTLVQSMGASSAAFGVACLLAPQALGKAYRLPSSPHTTQLSRHSGTRTLALAAWTFTARTREETDRVLAVAAGMNVVDRRADRAGCGAHHGCHCGASSSHERDLRRAQPGRPLTEGLSRRRSGRAR